MDVAILAHEQFPDRAKTAVGVLRYADRDVVAVLDRENAGCRVADFLPDVQDAPIVESVADVPESFDALLVGIAPIGGGFEESWRPDVCGALERGCDVIAGLHYFLEDDAEFRTLAAEHGGDIWDVRKPPDEAATERGIDAALVPTGQTGIVIEDWGIPIDRTVSDFTAGAVERMVRERGDDHELLVVEGQGAITHPAYSAVTCGILHGAMPDALVLCHEAGREVVHGYESFPIPDVSAVASLYEDLAQPVHETSVAAGCLNTATLGGDGAARDTLSEYGDAIGAPATDPVRFDAGEILDSLL